MKVGCFYWVRYLSFIKGFLKRYNRRSQKIMLKERRIVHKKLKDITESDIFGRICFGNACGLQRIIWKSGYLVWSTKAPECNLEERLNSLEIFLFCRQLTGDVPMDNDLGSIKIDCSYRWKQSRSIEIRLLHYLSIAC